jgi:uncharacterized protein YpmB
MVKSTLNNSSVALPAGSSFVGVAESVGSNVEISVSIKADRNCLVRIEQSVDRSNWDARLDFNYLTADGAKTFSAGVVHEYVRVSVVNNSGLSMSYMRMASYFLEEFRAAVVKGTDGTGVERVIKTDAEGKLLMTFTGEVGPSGKSAYELALDDGFVGTESAWLASLVGPQGIPGLSVKGDKGDQGEPGVDGVNGQDGAPGVDGVDGVGTPGLSAYQVWIQEGNSGTQADYLNSLKGTSIKVLGTLTSTQILALDTNTLNVNDAYFASDSYQLFVWNGVSSWISSGSMRGAEGQAGSDGVNGSAGLDGKSAYEIALEQGFVGTESAWLASLQGVDGTGITAQQAADILTNNAKVSYTDAALVSQHTAAIALNTAKVGITPEQSAAILANTAKVGISQEQSAAILANTAKIGLTQGVLDDIAINNAKISYTDAALVAQHTTDIAANTLKVGITPEQSAAIVANTAKVGITAQQAADIVANNAKVGISTQQAADIVANNAKISYTDGALVASHSVAIDLNTAKVGITAQQAADIATNNLKVGISPTQTSDILANNAKISYTDGALVALHTTQIAANTAKVGITAQQASDIATNNLKVGITPTQASDILANNAKISFSSEYQTALTNATNNISTNTAAIALNTAKLGIQKPAVFYEFTASGAAAATYNASAGFVKRTLNATDTDGSGDFTLSNGVMTCVTAGTYYVNFTANMNASDQFMHKIRKTTAMNEADVLFSTLGSAASNGTHTSSTEAYGVVPCLAGDTFELQVRCSQATANGGDSAGFGVNNIHAFVSWCRVL